MLAEVVNTWWFILGLILEAHNGVSEWIKNELQFLVQSLINQPGAENPPIAGECIYGGFSK